MLDYQNWKAIRWCARYLILKEHKEMSNPARWIWTKRKELILHPHDYSMSFENIVLGKLDACTRAWPVFRRDLGLKKQF